MARTRTIGAASMREVERPHRVADAAAHDDYREMIAAEIGRPDFHEHGPADDGRPVSLILLLLRPASLFLLSMIALATVGGFKLWRDGWFERMRPPATEPVVERPATHWIAGRGEAPPIDDKVPQPKPRAKPATAADDTATDDEDPAPAE